MSVIGWGVASTLLVELHSASKEMDSSQSAMLRSITPRSKTTNASRGAPGAFAIVVRYAYTIPTDDMYVFTSLTISGSYRLDQYCASNYPIERRWC
jgi:hypothetical protein